MYNMLKRVIQRVERVRKGSVGKVSKCCVIDTLSVRPHAIKTIQCEKVLYSLSSKGM